MKRSYLSRVGRAYLQMLMSLAIAGLFIAIAGLIAWAAYQFVGFYAALAIGAVTVVAVFIAIVEWYFDP